VANATFATVSDFGHRIGDIPGYLAVSGDSGLQSLFTEYPSLSKKIMRNIVVGCDIYLQ
jgi:hypothetical protein